MGNNFLAIFLISSLFLLLIMLVWQLTAAVFVKRSKHFKDKSMINNKASEIVAPEANCSLAGSAASVPSSFIEFTGLSELKKNHLPSLAKQAICYTKQLLPAAEEIWLWERQDNHFKLLASTNTNQVPASLSVSGSLAAALNELTEILYIPDLTLDKAFGFYDQLMAKLVDSGKRSLIVAPVNQVAVLVLAAMMPVAFSEADLKKLRSVVIEISYIFDVCRQQQQLKAELEKQKSVQEAILDLQTKPTLKEKITAALEMAVKTSQADTGSFLIYDQKAKKLKVKAVIGEVKGIAPGVEVSLGQGIAGWVAQHKKPLIINDALDWQGQADEKISSSISLPIISANVLIGVLNLGSVKPNYRFSLVNLQPVMQLLSQFGDAIVSAMQNEQWQKLYFNTVAAITSLIEKTDPDFAGHTAKVAEYARMIAKNMGLKENEIFLLELAGFLHDIGVAISEPAVREGRPLTTVERLALQHHPKVAVEALAGIPQLKEILPIILHHHENFDGSGYIDGLKGEQIPLGARILRVAEAFAAMTSRRPYREAKTKEEALDELRRLSGSQFDPKVVYAFSKAVEAKI